VKTAKKELTEVALETVTTRGLGLLDQYSQMLEDLGPLEKEYVLKLAILKATPMEELTTEELIELGEESIRVSELGIEISETLTSFWSQFKAVCLELFEQFKDIGAKVLASSLVAVLL